jgi:hypothetical protein
MPIRTASFARTSSPRRLKKPPMNGDTSIARHGKKCRASSNGQSSGIARPPVREHVEQRGREGRSARGRSPPGAGGTPAPASESRTPDREPESRSGDLVGGEDAHARVPECRDRVPE